MCDNAEATGGSLGTVMFGPARILTNNSLTVTSIRPLSVNRNVDKAELRTIVSLR